MSLNELGAALDLAAGAVDEVLEAIADAIEEDPDEVVTILRSDAPVGEKLEKIKELVQEG